MFPNYRRLIAAIVPCLCTFLSVSAQQDTTEYLFKKAKYSYVQFSFGYEPMFFSDGQTGRGFSAGLIGIVFNDKLALGLDFDGFAGSNTVMIQSYPTITADAMMSLDIEPLIRPRKLINFSFPIKIGYGGAQIYELSGNYPIVRNPQFVVIQPQAMVWVNLFKPISLGAGAAYRLPIGASSQDFATFSGFSGAVILRFKFYTREYMEKMTERQRQIMQQQPHN